MAKLRETLENAVGNLTEDISETFEDQLQSGMTKVEGAIKDKMDRVIERASVQESLEKFAGIDEEEILTFVPDKRNFSGIGSFLLGVLLLVLLPGFTKWLSLPFFTSGIFLLIARYLANAKVDVMDGYSGVVCHFGSPISSEAGESRTGRNWYISYAKFIPYLVSLRDHVVDMRNANFTWDFGSISLRKQVTFRIKEPAKFITSTTPAGIMKILNLYTSYIALRMITSMRDARVKFVGRDRIQNVMDALNSYLADEYGIEVVRANMPVAENDVIEDLEKIRTQLKRIEALSEDKQVKLESAIKDVESRMRKARKETRSKALALQHAKIAMETRIGERVNTERQSMLIDARKQLEEKISLLKREIASVRAKLEKAKAIRQSFKGLQAQLELRQAALKRRIFQRMIPKHVEVVGIEGAGAGLGLSFGNRLFRAFNGGQGNGDNPPPAPPAPPLYEEGDGEGLMGPA